MVNDINKDKEIVISPCCSLQERYMSDAKVMVMTLGLVVLNFYSPLAH